MTDLLKAVIQMAPAEYAGMLSAGWAFIVAICAYVAKKWPRPVDGSHWIPLYTIVNIIAQNTQYAKNSDDRKGDST